ncbi:hypothetical protein J4Q44_G00192570 [Coregonus suidteri]|uniref:Uncharacterized protein n=1 Tax=Coregonus suidteri TaxID=861788 RepID=A0AAN8LMJ7_9TELE
MIPQQFAPLLNLYDDDGQLDPPIFIELTPCAVEKQQCLDLAPAEKTPDRPSKRPRTDMNQAHIHVLELHCTQMTIVKDSAVMGGSWPSSYDVGELTFVITDSLHVDGAVTFTIME